MTKRRQIWKRLQKPEPFRNRYEGELATLRKYWARVRERCKGEAEFDRHTRELLRRTVIETGQIEGVYALDRGTTETLIAQGFEASLIGHGGAGPVTAEQAVDLLRDQEEAYRQGLDAVAGGMDLVGGQRTLGEPIVRELHTVLTRNQEFAEGRDQHGNRVRVELLRGTYKTRPNNPTRSDGTIEEYCPPEHVGPQMAELFRIYGELERDGADPVFLTAWFHHAFTTIHPFQDGNGRIVRLLASVILVQHGMLYLHIERGEQRQEYLDALTRADEGDLAPFVELVARQQMRALLDAVMFGTAEDPPRAPELEDRLGRAIERLRRGVTSDVDDLKWANAVEEFFQPSNVVVQQRCRALQAQLDPYGERIGVRTREGELTHREAVRFAEPVLPHFVGRPRSRVRWRDLEVIVAGSGSVKATFWCAEPTCPVRGLVLTFPGPIERTVPEVLLLSSRLPLVGDLEAGPEPLIARWREVVDETIAELLESFDLSA